MRTFRPGQGTTCGDACAKTEPLERSVSLGIPSGAIVSSCLFGSGVTVGGSATGTRANAAVPDGRSARYLP